MAEAVNVSFFNRLALVVEQPSSTLAEAEAEGLADVMCVAKKLLTRMKTSGKTWMIEITCTGISKYLKGLEDGKGKVTLTLNFWGLKS